MLTPCESIFCLQVFCFRYFASEMFHNSLQTKISGGGGGYALSDAVPLWNMAIDTLTCCR
jgi:hypothetical protein